MIGKYLEGNCNDLIQVLSHHFPGLRRNAKMGYAVSRLRFESNASRTSLERYLYATLLSENCSTFPDQIWVENKMCE